MMAQRRLQLDLLEVGLVALVAITAGFVMGQSSLSPDVNLAMDLDGRAVLNRDILDKKYGPRHLSSWAEE